MGRGNPEMKSPVSKFKLIREFAKTSGKDFDGLRRFLHNGQRGSIQFIQPLFLIHPCLVTHSRRRRRTLPQHQMYPEVEVKWLASREY